MTKQTFESECASIKYGLAGLRVDLALLKLGSALKLHYAPDQPRVPAGNGRDSGRWADQDAASNSDGSRIKPAKLAAVVEICVIAGVAHFTDSAGNRTYSATYDCRDGSSLKREGQGEAPGLIRQPFRLGGG